jgi:hypothetical protein
MLIRDIAGKFSGSKTFIEQLETAVSDFYAEVGQYLRAYVPPPPQLKGEETEGAPSAAGVSEKNAVDATTQLSEEKTAEMPSENRGLNDAVQAEPVAAPAQQDVRPVDRPQEGTAGIDYSFPQK